MSFKGIPPEAEGITALHLHGEIDDKPIILHIPMIPLRPDSPANPEGFLTPSPLPKPLASQTLGKLRLDVLGMTSTGTDTSLQIRITNHGKDTVLTSRFGNATITDATGTLPSRLLRVTIQNTGSRLSSFTLPSGQSVRAAMTYRQPSQKPKTINDLPLSLHYAETSPAKRGGRYRYRSRTSNIHNFHFKGITLPEKKKSSKKSRLERLRR